MKGEFMETLPPMFATSPKIGQCSQRSMQIIFKNIKIYWALTLIITSDMLGALLVFHFELIVKWAAICMRLILHLNCLGVFSMLRFSKANEGVGEVRTPVPDAINENTDFQKLLKHLHSHIKWISDPLEPHSLQQIYVIW